MTDRRIPPDPDDPFSPDHDPTTAPSREGTRGAQAPAPSPEEKGFAGGAPSPEEPAAAGGGGGEDSRSGLGRVMEAEVASDSLELAIARLRRRAWRIWGGTAALGFLAAALIVLGLGSYAAAAGWGGWVRPAAIAGIAALAGAAVVYARRRAGALRPAQLARALEDRDPRAKGLTTAVELAEALRKEPAADGSSAPSAPDFSSELAWAHVSVAAGRAVFVGPERAFPTRPLRHAAGAAAGAMVLVAAAFWLVQPMGSGLRQLALGAGEDDAPKPRPTPITGDISLTYVYPRYTGLPPKTVEGSNGEITALRGTEVRIETRADREVARAFLDIGGAATPLEVEGGRRLSGKLQVQGDGVYAFRFEDGRGRKLAVGPPMAIVAVEDGIPAISIDSPLPELTLTERDGVDLVFDASDDFGIAAVELVYRLPGGDEQHVPISSFADPMPRAGGSHRWELSTLGARPGDIVTYYLRARDNDAVSGPKWGQSRTQQIKIFSEAEHRRELIAKVEESWERMVLALGDRITPRAGPRKVEGVARIEAGSVADEKVREVAIQLTDVAAELGEDERAPMELLAAIRNLSRNLSMKNQATQATRGRGRRLGGSGQLAFIAQLDRVEADEQRELEQGILYLEALLDRQRLAQIEELTQELAADRRELVSLLEQYRDAPSDEAKDAIRQELSRLKARMAELMRQMSQLGKGLQDEHLNAEAMQAMAKERDMLSQLDEVERLLAEGKTDEALAELQKLGMQMDEMSQALTDASRGQTENDPALQQLAEDMEKYEQELDELARDQAQLAEATQALRREQGKEAREKLSQDGAGLLEELRAKIARAREHLGKIPDSSVPQRMVDDLGGAAERLDDLENALLAKDFDAAQESAASALAHSRALERALEAERGRMGRFSAQEEARLAPMHEEAQRATPLVRDVKEKLDEIFAGAPQQMTPGQQQRAERLAQRQSQLGERMEQLREQAEKVGEQAPIFDEEAQRSMAGAQRSMGEAEAKLRGQDPGGALASERSAQEHLQSLKRGLEEAREQAQASGGGGSFPMPMSGGGGQGRPGGKGRFDAKEKVAIPGADQYKAPEEFRKEILDAMKQGSPEGFQEPVRDYYQEIVK